MMRWAILLIIFLIPEIGFALEKDFYTYNGIVETEDAFKRISFIFGDVRYNSLFAIIGVLGFLIGGIVLYAKGLSGQKASPLSYIVPLLIGVMVYQAFIIPKGKIHIYDKTLNAYQVVNGVPDGLILLAWGLNTFERIVIDITDSNTANIFGKYETKAGGISFGLIKMATTKYKDVSDTYLSKSIGQYYNDCGLVPLANGDVDVNELRRTTENIQATMAKFNSKSLNTVYYTSASRAGTMMSCNDAWTAINVLLNNVATFDNTLKNMCKTTGFNPAVAGELASCKTLMSEATQLFGVVGGTSSQFVKNMYLSDLILQSTVNGSGDAAQKMLANRNFQIQSFGISNALNEWMPRIRGLLFTVILALIPVILLFAITPLFYRVIFLFCSLLVWYTMWSILDVIMHETAHDVAMRSFEHLANYKMGLDSIWLSPEASTGSMSVFGQARMMAFLLAGIITSGLFRMTAGSALASAVNQNMQRLVDTAATSAHSTMTPEGQGSLIHQTTQGLGATTTHGHHGTERMVTSAAWSDSKAVSSNNFQSNNGRNSADDLHSWAGTVAAANSAGETGKAEAARSFAKMQGNSSNEAISSMMHGAETIGATRGLMNNTQYKTALQGNGFDVSTPEKMTEAAAYVEYHNNYDNISRAGTTAQKIDKLRDLLDQRDIPTDHQTIADLYGKFEHGHSLATIKAHEASADSFIGTAAIKQSKEKNLVAGEHTALINDNRNPNDVWYDSGRIEAASTTGHVDAFAAMGYKSYQDAASTEKIWNVATSETRKGIADEHFDGDVVAAGRHMASTGPNEELGRYLQMEHVAQTLFDGDYTRAVIGSSNTDQRVVVGTDKLMDAIEDDPKLFNFNRSQIDAIKESESVELVWGFDPFSGSTANVSAYTGSRADHSQSSEMDFKNEYRSGDRLDATTLSGVFRSPSANEDQMFNSYLSDMYTNEHKRTELAEGMGELYSRQVQASSTDHISMSMSLHGGADAGASSGSRNGAGSYIAGNLGLSGNATQEFTDSANYNTNYSNAENTLNGFDKEARSFAEKNGSSLEEERALYAGVMTSKLSAYDQSYTSMISEEARSESKFNEAKNYSDDANEGNPGKGKIQRE